MNSFSLPAFLGRFANAVLGTLLGHVCVHSSLLHLPALTSLNSSLPTGTTICGLLCTKTSLVWVFLLDYVLFTCNLGSLYLSLQLSSPLLIFQSLQHPFLWPLTCFQNNQQRYRCNAGILNISTHCHFLS